MQKTINCNCNGQYIHTKDCIINVEPPKRHINQHSTYDICTICNQHLIGYNIDIKRTKHLIDVHNFVIDPKLIKKSRKYFK